MVQILPPKTSLSNQLGQALGSGISSGMQTGINRGNLQSAFNQLSPNGNFTDQLKQIAPILLSTPGGAQALAELAPILGQRSENAAVAKSIENLRNTMGTTGTQPAAPQGQPGQQPQAGAEPSSQEGFKRPRAPSSAETTFPQRTAGPQPSPEMSPSQLQNYALDLMQNSLNTGKPIPYQDALNAANALNQQIRQSNAVIQQEKDRREGAQKTLGESIIARAQNSGLIKEPEDRTVAEKFALEARNAPNENEAYQYVRTKMRAYDNAKASLATTMQLGNPGSNVFRKLFGNYKDQETIINDLQHPLKFFKQNGLYDEAKSILVNDLGLGNEQAHSAVFPFSKEEKSSLNEFPKNAEKRAFSPTLIEQRFPGENNALADDQFNKFKDQLATYLDKFPEVDLVTLRGNLNQDKRYSWQDIYKGIDQLVDERRFNPDVEQEKQLNSIRQAPIPGLGAYFQYLWTGKK